MNENLMAVLMRGVVEHGTVLIEGRAARLEGRVVVARELRVRDDASVSVDEDWAGRSVASLDTDCALIVEVETDLRERAVMVWNVSLAEALTTLALGVEVKF